MAEFLTNIKHLCHYMNSGKIRLGRQDTKFIASIYHLITTKSQVTSNQVKLFNHLLRKYERQFSKLNLDINNLMVLPWNTPIVESAPHYTDAYLSLVDGEIIFRCPYNTKFLKDFRELPNNESFVWDKIKKHYRAKYNTTHLKLCVTSAFKHFNIVHCCPIIIRLLDELVKYDNIKYWNPTLTKAGNNYIIAASNQSIDHVIANIELSNDPFILNYLSKHAINIDETITTTPIQIFAATFNPVVEYDNSETLVNWLVEIKCDGIYLENKHNWTTLKQLISKVKIPMYETSAWRKTPNPKFKGFVNPVLIKGMADTLSMEIHPLSKIITMVNTNPVPLK